VRIVPAEEWTHGEAKGICEQLSLVDVQPLVEVRDRENEADLARTLIHEYAHAFAPLRRRRRHRAVETRSRGRSRRVRRRALLRTRHQWVGILPRSLGVGRSRGRSRAAWTDQSDGRGTHRRARRATCSLNWLTNRLLISLFRWLSFLRPQRAKAHSHLRRERLNFCQGRIPRAQKTTDSGEDSLGTDTSSLVTTAA